MTEILYKTYVIKRSHTRVRCPLVPCFDCHWLWSVVAFGYHVLRLLVWSSLVLCSKSSLIILCVEMAIYSLLLKTRHLKVRLSCERQPLTICVTVKRTVSFSEPQFCYPKHVENHSTCLRLLYGMKHIQRSQCDS